MKQCKPSINGIQGLQGLGDIESSKYASVKNIDDSYGGQLDWGRRFLKDLVKKRRENGDDRATDGVCTNLLEKAFDNPPNEHSSLALEMFLVQNASMRGAEHARLIVSMGLSRGFGITCVPLLPFSLLLD